MKDIALSKFFYAIGGQFSHDTIVIQDNSGNFIEKHNGDLCNGKAGTLKFFVNGEPNSEFGDYILKPFSLVPPGDVLKIEFN